MTRRVFISHSRSRRRATFIPARMRGVGNGFRPLFGSLSISRSQYRQYYIPDFPMTSPVWF